MITEVVGPARRRWHAQRRVTERAGERACGDEGSATLEFVLVGVLLLVPLAYALVSVFAVQSAAYGVSAAAREAGRAFVQTPGGEDPYERAFAAAYVSLQDHGIDLEPDQLTITCSAAPCLTPGATVEIGVDLDVALPFTPDLFGEVPASIAVDGRHIALVDRFRPVGAG